MHHNPCWQYLLNLLQQQQYITLSEFMHIVINHQEYGYYANQEHIFGNIGDFITAPEISQLFGEMIGIWLIQQWQQANCRPIHLIELGPGRGILLDDILRSTKHIHNFHNNIHIHYIECSPQLQQIQHKRLIKYNIPITWYNNLDKLPNNRYMFFIANEFFDALPSM